MLKVVSNTTPIISLLKLSKLEILRQLYRKVYIPLAVFEEVEQGKNKFYYQDVSIFDWIEISDIEDKNAIKYFLDLDDGEAEAIILASELNADLILMDEQIGRYHALHAGLKVTGTMGVLIRAKQKSIIKNVKPLLFELKEKEVWLSDNLIREVLKIVGEK